LKFFGYGHNESSWTSVIQLKEDDAMENMTPSLMTDGQIDKAADIFRAQLRKHRTEFSSEVVQNVLGQGQFGPELVVVLRKWVEIVSGMIVRHVRVNRQLSAEQSINATGRAKYVDDFVVNSMPVGDGPDEVDLVYFKLGRDNLDRELELRGLKIDQ
jgi:hypothetical protein